MKEYVAFILVFSTLWILSADALMIRFEELAKKYDSSSRPQYEEGRPTSVNVSLQIDSLEIDDIRQVIKMNGEMRQEWNDFRLIFSSVVNHETSIGLEGQRGARIKHHLWLPDLTIAEGFHSTRHTARDFLKIQNNGHLTWTQQVFYEFPCKFKYQHYPLGKQECKLGIQSLGYETREVDIRWTGDDAVHYKKASVSLRYKIDELEISAPNIATFDRAKRQLQVKIKLEHMTGWTVKHTVLPFVAAVATAYLAFFINVRGGASRMVVCGTALLMASIFNELAYNKTPEVPYTMAIEVFTGTCVTFIWLAMAECVAVDVLFNLNAKSLPSARNSFSTEHSEILEEDSSTTRGYVAALWLDRCSRVLYPVVFLAFNAVFWIIYR